MRIGGEISLWNPFEALGRNVPHRITHKRKQTPTLDFRPSTMPDPQDDHKILETSLRPDCGTTTTSTLLDLAPELIIRIASLLEIRDLLAFRRVCLDLIRRSQVASN